MQAVVGAGLSLSLETFLNRFEAVPPHALQLVTNGLKHTTELLKQPRGWEALPEKHADAFIGDVLYILETIVDLREQGHPHAVSVGRP